MPLCTKLLVVVVPSRALNTNALSANHQVLCAYTPCCRCTQSLGPELQGLLELLDAPHRQRQLGLAEVHVSLATLEEVFLTVVKQVRE